MTNQKETAMNDRITFIHRRLDSNLPNGETICSSDICGAFMIRTTVMLRNDSPCRTFMKSVQKNKKLPFRQL
ncbi:hypothetical protein B1691_13745 [Geobacillus sp. 47C-IIb]|nr:hypothetical protein GTID1_00715 [Geobacillus thermodenitrificans]OQP08778.1 hypothetical protein B1691_13745 [Geobacillus sp. 47C-IIb]